MRTSILLQITFLLESDIDISLPYYYYPTFTDALYSLDFLVNFLIELTLSIHNSRRRFHRLRSWSVCYITAATDVASATPTSPRDCWASPSLSPRSVMSARGDSNESCSSNFIVAISCSDLIPGRLSIVARESQIAMRNTLRLLIADNWQITTHL